MSVPRARLMQLMKVSEDLVSGHRRHLLTMTQAQCDVFSTTYNPEGLRLGNKVLRQRLRGPALAAYYPRKDATIKDVRRMFGPHIYAWDQKELDRLESLDLYVASSIVHRHLTSLLTLISGFMLAGREPPRRRLLLLVSIPT